MNTENQKTTENSERSHEVRNIIGTSAKDLFNILKSAGGIALSLVILVYLLPNFVDGVIGKKLSTKSEGGVKTKSGVETIKQNPIKFLLILYAVVSLFFGVDFKDGKELVLEKCKEIGNRFNSKGKKESLLGNEQTYIINDMRQIEKIVNSPEIEKIMNSPEMEEIMKNPEIAGLMNNPEMMKIMDNLEATNIA